MNVEFHGDMRNTTERRRRNKEGNKIIQVKIGNVMKGGIPTAKLKKNLIFSPQGKNILLLLHSFHNQSDFLN